MLDEWGTPQITDFGLSVLATVNNQQFSSNRGGDWHFLAPEILGAEKNIRLRLAQPRSQICIHLRSL